MEDTGTHHRPILRDTLPPVLISAGILLAGNGLLTTLVALRGRAEGFSESWIGAIGAAYFLGFMVASFVTAILIRRAGHIRVFAALSALAAISTLFMLLVRDPLAWSGARFILGFAFSGITTVIESWLNQMADNRDRGRVLSLYRVVDLGFVTAGQFLLPVFGPAGHEIFVVVAIIYCLGLVPVSLSALSSPPPPSVVGPRLGQIWLISPVACFGCLSIGLTNGAFRTIGPLYAQQVGLDVDQVVWFMSLGIVAGAILQYPLGWLSDRTDRRRVLLLATTAAAGSSISLSGLDGGNPLLVFAGAALFGGFALPLYSLSTAHANDRCPAGMHVTMAVTLLLIYAVGAAAGSQISAAIVDAWGAPWFFTYTCVVHGVFLVFVAIRTRQRSEVPAEKRSSFVALLRTSPAIFRLGRDKSGHHD